MPYFREPKPAQNRNLEMSKIGREPKPNLITEGNRNVNILANLNEINLEIDSNCTKSTNINSGNYKLS